MKQFVPEQVCLKCQGCCRFKDPDSVWAPCLLDEEIQVLLDNKIPPAAISASRRILPIPEQGGEGFICPFLECSSNKCKIYSIRPFECRLYPFLINLRGKRVILTLDLNCAYIREKLNSKELKEYTAELIKFLNSPEQIKLLKENPQIIQAYEEVSEIVELKVLD